MDKPPTPEHPERMNTFMTTEHFTLQSARSIINGEIMSRVNIYFTTLSSVLIASAFLAQVPQMGDLFRLFTWVAFPVTVLLGFLTMSRVMVLGYMDSVYIRAINRIRHFYVHVTPEAERYLLFPARDDDRSVGIYGGYTMSFLGHLLSVGQAVNITNSIVATTLLSALLSHAAGMTALDFVPYGLAIFALVYFLHGFLGSRLARVGDRPEYHEVRFSALQSGPPRITPALQEEVPALSPAGKDDANARPDRLDKEGTR